MLDSLVSLDPKGGVHPWLATSWQVSPDGKSYTFELRKDVTFSDGTPFDAAAVKANLDHVVDPKTKSELAAGLITPYKGTEVIGPHTVRVDLSRPHSPLLSALSTPYLGIQSPASLKLGADALARKVVGSGPFVIDAFTPRQGITYHRNPKYAWPPRGTAHTGPAYLDKLEFKVLREDSVRVGALTSGQVDAIGSVPPVNVSQVKADSRLWLETRQAPGGNYNYYPNTAKGVFSDVRVRQAFRAAIDLKTIIGKLYFGVFQPAASPIAPSTFGYDPGTEQLGGYDPQAAAKLLDEAGWTARDAQGYRTKNGERLTVRWMFVKMIAREQRAVLSEQVQAEARKAGIDVQFLDVTPSNYAPIALRGDYDLSDYSWQRVDADALRDLFASANIPNDQGGSGANASRYSNKDVDAWLDQTLDTVDPAKRAELYAKVQRKVVEDAAVFPVYTFNYVLGAARRVHGVTWEAQAYPSFYDAWVAAR
ncbi:ABC transporter substrate-binding protein [Streptosporangium sp. NPDC020145]|uniref:ABC transporter substrate-binding protein n=1 Tax=Streptosporangium jomthongense TaxID=1193683 RepID=A0ABV8F7P2_9ACTN